jgi:hypothetical protein
LDEEANGSQEEESLEEDLRDEEVSNLIQRGSFWRNSVTVVGGLACPTIVEDSHGTMLTMKCTKRIDIMYQ